MSVIFSAQAAPLTSPTIENLDSTRYVIEANLSGASVVCDVSNVTPYVQLTAQGASKTLQGFSPADSDFVPAVTIGASGVFYLAGSFRYMRFRLLSGTATYLAVRGYQQ